MNIELKTLMVFPVHYLQGSRVVYCMNVYDGLVCCVKEGLSR